MKEAGLILLCYLIGSIPFSYLFGQIFGGVDIRAKGSGNVGATNVLRTLGIWVALAALAGDFVKGIIAAWLGLTFGGYPLAALCSGAAVAGHCWPVFLGFRGGKGVATSGGIVLFLMPNVLVIMLIVFTVITAVTRYVSLASITVAALFPVMSIFLHKPLSYILLSLFMAVLVIFRHRENIQRLREGNESKLGQKA